MSALRHEEIYGTHWSADEDAVVQADYGRRTAADLAEELGRSVLGVRQRARVLGLAQPVKARIVWTAAADGLLRAAYGQRTAADLAAELGTTDQAVWARAQELGLAKIGRHAHWSADDDRLLRELYGTISVPALALRMGRSYHSVANHAQRLGITRAGAETQRRDEIAQLRAENDHLRHASAALSTSGAVDAAHAPAADARRLAVLIAYRLNVIDAAEAAVVLGVPPARLLVEVAKAAKLGQDITHATLEEGR